MTESITSSGELRQFASENSGRRKIDVQESLDLHRRAANQIDLLGEHLTEMQRQVNTAARNPTAPAAVNPMPAVAAGEDPSKGASIVLQRAQDTADIVIAEAEGISAQAQRTRDEADAIAEAKAKAALAEARGQAAHIIDAAQQRANEVAEATALVADRAAFAQRHYRDKTSGMRADAESLIEMAQRMETVASEDLPTTLTARPFTEATQTPAEPPTTPPVPAPAPAALSDSAPLVSADDEVIVLEAEDEIVLNIADALPPPPLVEPATVLPPPPPAAAAVQVVAAAAVLPPPPDPSLRLPRQPRRRVSLVAPTKQTSSPQHRPRMCST